ncbi:histidine kinase [Streptomyces aureoverticillatus]|uniref:histidine kinase n=1 Tax=Streptomyces aureoverticillatus TaxID=66871 RepID=UPI0013DC4058|nr:histidine kinase [Streptomyces aureoverticillatus]QIB47663.1 histidine kinase [Streptomyces aureoverticillatus]
MSESDDDKVLFFTFKDPERARDAFHDVTQLPTVSRAAILARSQDGELAVPETYPADDGGAAAVGGAVGALVGLLGGPLGVLFGWGAGALLGVSADADEAEDSIDALTVLSQGVNEGETVVIAGLTESDPSAADEIAGRLGGTVVRVPAQDVEAEVRSAQEAAENAVRAARKQHREQRRAEFKDKVDHLFRHEGRG